MVTKTSEREVSGLHRPWKAHEKFLSGKQNLESLTELRSQKFRSFQNYGPEYCHTCWWTLTTMHHTRLRICVTQLNPYNVFMRWKLLYHPFPWAELRLKEVEEVVQEDMVKWRTYDMEIASRETSSLGHLKTLVTAANVPGKGWRWANTVPEGRCSSYGRVKQRVKHGWPHRVETGDTTSALPLSPHCVLPWGFHSRIRRLKRSTPHVLRTYSTKVVFFWLPNQLHHFKPN